MGIYRGSIRVSMLILCFLINLIAATNSAQASDKAVSYYYVDPQGTVLATTDASGNITSVADYRPYGERGLGMQRSGPGYTGHVDELESGLVYMQQRYLDPQTGRFLSVDSVTVSTSRDLRHVNRYAYAYNNPTTFTDPDGRCPVCLVYVGVALFSLSDYANAPGIGDKPVSMTPVEKIEAVADVLPVSRSVSTVRSVVRTTERLTQRAASLWCETSGEYSYQSTARVPIKRKHRWK